MQALTQQQLIRTCPAIFQNNPSSNTSDKYQFYSTYAVVEKLCQEGWIPVKATEQRVRNLDNKGFQKHMIRFRNVNDLNLSTGECAELVLTNSHNGLSAYKLMAGVFRMICSNGMVVPESLIGNISVRHIGSNPIDVLEASFKIIKELPKAMDQLNEMKEITLSYDESRAFAKAAYMLRFPDEVSEKGYLLNPKQSPQQLLVKRRREDFPSTLYNTFNTVQENIIKGVKGFRKVNSIDKDISLNKALWALASEMQRLKS